MRNNIKNHPNQFAGKLTGGFITSGAGILGKVRAAGFAGNSLSFVGHKLGLPADKLEEIENKIRCLCGDK